MTTTTRKAPAKSTEATPVANLAQARKEQASAKQRHPAGKKVTPAKAAPAKGAAKKAAEKPAAEKRTYPAEARCGKTNTRSTTGAALTHALDVQIDGRKGAHYTHGVIVGSSPAKRPLRRRLPRSILGRSRTGMTL